MGRNGRIKRQQMVPRGARNEKKKTTTRTTKDNKRVPRIARNEDILPRITRICTNGFLAGLGTKEENDNINNTKQQGTTRFLAGLGTKIFYHEPLARRSQ